MTITEIIAIAGAIFTVGGVVLAAGAALARLAGQDARISKLERGAEDQGRRVGGTEADIKAIQESRTVEREYTRRLTGAQKSDE
jgi:hypothetical protein